LFVTADRFGKFLFGVGLRLETGGAGGFAEGAGALGGEVERHGVCLLGRLKRSGMQRVVSDA